jgi:hypothetical protein
MYLKMEYTLPAILNFQIVVDHKCLSLHFGLRAI